METSVGALSSPLSALAQVTQQLTDSRDLSSLAAVQGWDLQQLAALYMLVSRLQIGEIFHNYLFILIYHYVRCFVVIWLMVVAILCSLSNYFGVIFQFMGSSIIFEITKTSGHFKNSISDILLPFIVQKSDDTKPYLIAYLF